MSRKLSRDTPFVAAAVQMNSRGDKRANVACATRLVERAVERGAGLVALPELFNCLTNWDRIIAAAEPIPGPTSTAMSALAARLQITLLAGSIAEASSQAERAYNTSLLFGPDGQLLARYRKMHLFDVELPNGVTVRESRHIIAGERTVVTPTPLANLGQATCYDLRFPELFRRLMDANAEVFLIPSAFTRPTGHDHWEVLLRARAIENQVFVVAPNQCGCHTAELTSYGNSIIVDPWGNVMARASDEKEEVIVAELDREIIDQMRARLPVLKHRHAHW